MTFHDGGDFGRSFGGGRRRRLTQQEIDTTGRRIRNIVGDPARAEFSDDAFNAWSERQVDRTTDIDGNIVDSRIEPFKPELTRRDLNLDSSVGDKADNARRDVFAVKKVMSRAGAFAFDPGNEPTTVPNDRFKKAIRAFQAGNDLKVDGKIFPGGPTIHMLGFTAIGREDGRPSGFDAAEFKQRTGRDPNLTLSGRAIFKTLGEGGAAGSPGTQEAMHRLGTGIGRGRPGRGGGKQGKPWLQRKIEEQFDKKHDSPRRRFKTKKPEVNEPKIVKSPAHIIKYPDGRVYIVVNKEGKITSPRSRPGAILIEEIRNKIQVGQIQEVFHENYPDLDDRRSFQEREAAGKDGYVYGPVRDKNGKLSYTPLVDPSSRGFFGGARLLRVPITNGIILTLAQIKAMGLSKWHVVDK